MLIPLLILILSGVLFFIKKKKLNRIDKKISEAIEKINQYNKEKSLIKNN